MSRSGYSDDIDDNWRHIMWRGAVESSIRGKRGQALLQELVEALDAMSDKRLYPGSFATANGEYCTLGVLGAKRGTKMDDLGSGDDGCNPHKVGQRFGIATALAAEIMYLNDEYSASDWIGVDVEICGPMRPDWPDWGSHRRYVRVHNDKSAAQRWAYMRKWAQEQIVEGGAA